MNIIFLAMQAKWLVWEGHASLSQSTTPAVKYYMGAMKLLWSTYTGHCILWSLEFCFCATMRLVLSDIHGVQWMNPNDLSQLIWLILMVD